MIDGDEVVTLAGSGCCCVADGRGERACFACPSHLAMDDLGRILVVGDKIKTSPSNSVVECCVDVLRRVSTRSDDKITKQSDAGSDAVHGVYGDR